MAWPVEYKKRYEELRVYIPADIVSNPCSMELPVRICRYQNTGQSDPTHATKNIDLGTIGVAQNYLTDYTSWAAGRKPGRTEGDAWVELPSGFDRHTIYNVHTGKGSWQEARAALQLLIWGNVSKGKAACPFWGLNDAKSWLNDYCRSYVGLDCLGFVEHAVSAKRNASLSWKQAATTDMGQFTDSAKLVGSLSSVQGGMVAVYLQVNDPYLAPKEAGTRHILLLDGISSVDGSCLTAHVAESIGQYPYDGLNEEDICLRFDGCRKTNGADSGRPVFILTRWGKPGFSVTLERPVYIARI